MSADLLLSLFFTLSIHGTVRKGHEEDCTVWRECLCLFKYVQVCFVQKSHLPPSGEKKRRFTSFFCLAAIPVTGQLCPSCSNKMCHYLTWVSILRLGSCNTSTGGFLFPLSLLVWILSYPLNWAGQKVWRSRWWKERRGEERRGESSSITPSQGCCPCSLGVWGTAFASEESAAVGAERA